MVSKIYPDKILKIKVNMAGPKGHTNATPALSR